MPGSVKPPFLCDSTHSMNRFFRKHGKSRSRSPSLEFPKLRLPRQKAVDASVSGGASLEGSPKTTPKASSPRGKTHSLTSTGSSTGSTEVSDVTDVVTLQVPQHPRIRSSSFDSSTLQHQEDDSNTLRVPFSKSLDAGSSDDNASDREVNYSFLDVPKYFRRRSLDIPRLCVHCIHLESLSSHEGSPQSSPGSETSRLDQDDDFWDCSSPSDGEDSEDEEDEEDEDDDDTEDEPLSARPQCPVKSPATRRKLVRTKQHFGWDSQEIQGYMGYPSRPPVSCQSSVSSVDPTPCTPHLTNESSVDSTSSNVVTLQVPMLKPRSSSVDVAYLSVPDDHQHRQMTSGHRLDVPPQKRSSSVDVSLPTDDSHSYKAIHSPTENK